MQAQVRLDALFPTRAQGLSDAAFRLHVDALCWSARNVTGGRIANVELPQVSRVGAPEKCARQLVGSGLWSADDLGWVINGLAMDRVGWRADIPDDVRETVYARDGYRCVGCGSPDDLTLDHIQPWSRFGSDDPRNLQTLCGSCNSRKGARV